jgi:hypothetical protein
MSDELEQKSAGRTSWTVARWSVTVAGSSSRSMAAVRYMRSSSWKSFDCTIDQRSEGMLQQGLCRMFSGVWIGNIAKRAFVDALPNWHSATTRNIWTGHAPRHQRHSLQCQWKPSIILKFLIACVPQLISILRTCYTSIHFNPKTRFQHRWGRIYLVRSM